MTERDINLERAQEALLGVSFSEIDNRSFKEKLLGLFKPKKNKKVKGFAAFGDYLVVDLGYKRILYYAPNRVFDEDTPIGKASTWNNIGTFLEEKDKLLEEALECYDNASLAY